MQARMIFYLRCAAYFRPLPRTRLQNRQPQTRSRGRAMLAPMTKISLPPRIGVFHFCSVYMMTLFTPRVHLLF